MKSRIPRVTVIKMSDGKRCKGQKPGALQIYPILKPPYETLSSQECMVKLIFRNINLRVYEKNRLILFPFQISRIIVFGRNDKKRKTLKINHFVNWKKHFLNENRRFHKLQE